uniref:Uncharacterized protein n=1 Tax=Anguilla anguilla TaxID=7936 RepID=A0A0E9T5I0_ANGAN
MSIQQLHSLRDDEFHKNAITINMRGNSEKFHSTPPKHSLRSPRNKTEE